MPWQWPQCAVAAQSAGAQRPGTGAVDGPPPAPHQGQRMGRLRRPAGGWAGGGDTGRTLAVETWNQRTVISHRRLSRAGSCPRTALDPLHDWKALQCLEPTAELGRLDTVKFSEPLRIQEQSWIHAGLDHRASPVCAGTAAVQASPHLHHRGLPAVCSSIHVSPRARIRVLPWASPPSTQIIDSSHGSSGVVATADFTPSFDELTTAARSIA